MHIVHRKDPKEWLLEHTVIDPSGCWLWQGCLQLDRRTGPAAAYKATTPMRLSYAIEHNGQLPHRIKHICEERRCVNPDHLAIDTRRRARKNTELYPLRCVTNKKPKPIIKEKIKIKKIYIDKIIYKDKPKLVDNAYIKIQKDLFWSMDKLGLIQWNKEIPIYLDQKINLV